MRIYKIYDEELDILMGTLLYFEKARDFIIELSDTLDEWTAPLLFTHFVKRGVYTIPREICMLWVRGRIIPNGRQNIGAILNTHKLREYEEISFLEISKGRCSQDNIYIKKVSILPDYVIERRKKNIKECVILGDNNLLCFFEDETTKKTNLNDMADVDGIEKVLRHPELAKSCKIGTGGYSITFNDTIDIPAFVLYEKGKDIPLGLEDFISFSTANLLDTAECCDLLECTRQNIAYILKKKLINPIRKNVKGSLYLKGEVIRTKW